ncbi:MAG: sulfatase-like hydrolase/transferase [Gemmatimonadales bacterium]
MSGLVEGLEWVLLSLIPGALSWRTGNSAYASWMAPLVMGCLGLAIGLLVLGVARMVRRPLAWDSGLVAIVTFSGAYLTATLQGQVFSEVAALLLAAGITAVITRWYRGDRERLQRFMLRSLPALIGLVLLLAGTTTGWRHLAEQRAMAALPAPPDGALNVLLLVLDTQRADHLSMYGYARPTSPRLDAFALESVRYDNAQSSSSWTLPSHASLFTGEPLSRHRAGVMGRPFLDGRFPTLAERLRASGWATGGFIANTFWTGRNTGLARGFAHYEDFYGNPGDALARTTIGRRMAYEVLPRLGRDDVPGRKWAPTLNRDLLQWLDGLHGRPFFAFVNYFDVHSPLKPVAPFAGRFRPLDATGRTSREIDLGAIGTSVELPSPERIAELVDRYDESILGLDDALGALFDQLKERGLLERTIVIVTADHGESWGEHGMIYHGHSLYREQTHVPLLVHWPGREHAGTVVRSPVGIDQIPATVAAAVQLSGVAFPGKALPLADDSTASVRTELARRSAVPSNWPASRGSVAGVIEGPWHYIEEESGSAELFDVSNDSLERNNLAGDTAHAALGTSFSAQLSRALAGSGLSWPSRAGRGTP